MGYVQAISACCGCGRIFCYNPHRVPSCIVNGTREPICEACVRHYNPIRRAKGLDEIKILPGAYEAMDEGEL